MPLNNQDSLIQKLSTTFPKLDIDTKVNLGTYNRHFLISNDIYVVEC